MFRIGIQNWNNFGTIQEYHKAKLVLSLGDGRYVKK